MSEVAASLMPFASAEFGATCWFSQAVLIQLFPPAAVTELF